jgi:hypothetical protein
MSLEKIGNMEHNMNIQRKPVVQREQRPEDVHDTFVHDTGKDLTKVSNPPFLPIGDTQSIYRK